jgi:hypothetical protein
MLRNALFGRPSIGALMAGISVFIVCSLLRVAGNPLVDQVPVVAATLTFLVFIIPGSITGFISPRSSFWNGVILGVIAAAFVTFQSFQFRQPNWSSIFLYQAVGFLACLNVPLCIVGALGGRFVRGR